METTFLSIKDASQKYGKAEITIRRLVRSIVNDASSGDRGMISPAPSQAQKLKLKRKPFSYTLSTDLLEKHFGATATAPRARHLERGPEYTRLLEQTSEGLKQQLVVKDEQIRALNTSIQALSERQHEMNVLMKGLQQQLLLTSGRKKRGWWLWKNNES